jgi:DNA-binding MarR family transcriptional regulator
MAGKIAEQIQQTKPFIQKEEEVYLNLVRTCELINQQLAELFRSFGISPAQYNVLRILRGAGAAGLHCTEVGRRMISHDPDITRLFDRLESAGLVRRGRSAADRRLVVGFITEAGLEVLAKIDQPLFALHQRQFACLNSGQMDQLIELLENVWAESIQPRAAAVGE